MNKHIFLCIALVFVFVGCAAELNDTPTDPNAPVLDAIGNKSVLAGNNLNFTVTATDPNSETLTFTTDGTVGVGNPYSGSGAATFNLSDNQIFNWTPTSVGVYTVKFTVTNESGLEDSETVVITVTSDSGGSTSTGESLFTTYCSSCHKTGGSAFVLGPVTVTEISDAIARNDGGMSSLSFLTTSQRQAISDYLAAL